MAEQSISFFSACARSIIDVVSWTNSRSKRESASSATRCVHFERTLGLASARLERRYGVDTRTSKGPEKRRLRITVPVKLLDIIVVRNLAMWDMDFTTLATWVTSSEVGTRIIA